MKHAPPALDLQHVSFVADGRTLVDDVTWRVWPREHWVILGPNGAGKSTLLNLACGYLWPNAGGCILRNGEEHADLSELRLGIGWVSSTLTARIPADEIVRDTIASGAAAQLGFWRYPGRRTSPRLRARARNLIRRFGLVPHAHQPFGTLSQGEQQKVLVARALMTRPYLLVLDEPGAGLDPGARARFLDFLDELARHRATPSLLLVTHHLEEITPAFGKALLMQRGRIVASGPTERVITGENLSRLFHLPVRVRRHQGRYTVRYG